MKITLPSIMNYLGLSTAILLCLTAEENCMGQTHEVKIAIAQIHCIDSDRDGNFVRIENAIADAAKQGAEIVCFPETAIYGWVNPAAHELAQPIPGKDFEVLAALAKQYKVFLTLGLAEKEGDRLYDTALLIDDDGNLLLKHRKINTLEHLLTPPYTRGSDVKTVETKFGRIGMLICADTFDAAVVDRMKQEKPELLLVPYGWAANKQDWPKHGVSLKNTIASAATTIGFPLIGTNLVGCISQGPWTGMIYGGQSYATDQAGKVIAQGKDRDRDIMVFSVTTTSTQQ
ncbi:carbon-nitrogen hydrolase family protein [Aureliella helgolandensis]|uniref:(R)-stereoselective amidase n=1 Tax=Aureliella helgolandensis TaxID=2527968 RepID=A0A518G9F1_9BACT|nr:carbon-nitrogen hydrolase family protein [Aureliella helgolandensis]QDV25225.1 (R)-stereoselective amidase [Aureliella helgolandensis]